MNPIERLWKFFHKQIHYNKYHATFAAFSGWNALCFLKDLMNTQKN
ncbi:MAG TPA: hypothetical protein DD381_11950 [Lentisphaeria bacterium]|nr:hypothetical protein [Lentisphaeria bacterium]